LTEQGLQKGGRKNRHQKKRRDTRGFERQFYRGLKAEVKKPERNGRDENKKKTPEPRKLQIPMGVTKEKKLCDQRGGESKWKTRGDTVIDKRSGRSKKKADIRPKNKEYMSEKGRSKKKVLSSCTSREKGNLWSKVRRESRPEP